VVTEFAIAKTVDPNNLIKPLEDRGFIQGLYQ